MISAEREQEIRKLIRAAQHNGNWEYVIDFDDVTDLLALCDEQKERIAALERKLVQIHARLDYPDKSAVPKDAILCVQGFCEMMVDI